jgi:thymidylate kinase
MIVEFIGSTGAGKTTLIKHILYVSQREGINAVVGNDFVLKQSRLDGIKSYLFRTILINLISMVACLATWRNNLEFYLFAIRIILELPGTVTRFEKLFLMKNVLKKIGIYEIIRRHGSEQQVYLVDEGTLHVAHNLFVQVSGEADINDLSTFAKLVPLPHVVVYVRQDESVLIERTLARGHKRVPDHSFADAAHFVKQAVNMFDELVQNPAIEGRLLVVDSAQNIVMAPGYGNDPLPIGVSKLVQAGIQASTENNPVQVRQLAR